MKKKIAICIPTYNECKNIENTTRKIDTCLKKYSRLGFETIIVNADNNSNNNTNAIFNKLKKKKKKVSLISNKIGKGNNLLNFFKFCDKENIDYALTIDADVKSLKPIWIDKYLKELIQGKKDYVTPIYQRSRYEGSTTNHFAFPLIYSICGIPIRQPIAGDFSFNKKFINCILNEPIDNNVKKYGIDLFMTLTACFNKLNVAQIKLEKKLHNPSFYKMENMFVDVLNTFIFVWKNHYEQEILPIHNNYNFNFLSNIDRSRRFVHKKYALEKNEFYRKKIKYLENESDLWLQCLYSLIKDVKNVTESDKQRIFNIFMYHATNFWLIAEKKSSKECETLIINQAKNLLQLVRSDYLEKSNN